MHLESYSKNRCKTYNSKHDGYEILCKSMLTFTWNVSKLIKDKNGQTLRKLYNVHIGLHKDYKNLMEGL